MKPIATRMLRVVFFGPPGAGKGTQCRLLTQRFQIPHVSTGEMLRATKDDSPLGRVVASYIDGGSLAPDPLVMRILVKRLRRDDCRDGYLLDGFPRTVNQAQMFDEHLAAEEASLDHVLALEVDQDTLIKRLLARSISEGRVDDTEEVISQRLRVFAEQTAPVLDHYRSAGLVAEIDGLGSPEEVFERICAILD